MTTPARDETTPTCPKCGAVIHEDFEDDPNGFIMWSCHSEQSKSDGFWQSWRCEQTCLIRDKAELERQLETARTVIDNLKLKEQHVWGLYDGMAAKARDLEQQLAAEKDKTERLSQRLTDDEDEFTPLMTELAAARETIRRWERLAKAAHVSGIYHFGSLRIGWGKLAVTEGWFVWNEHFPMDRVGPLASEVEALEQIERWEAEQQKGNNHALETGTQTKR